MAANVMVSWNCMLSKETQQHVRHPRVFVVRNTVTVRRDRSHRTVTFPKVLVPPPTPSSSSALYVNRLQMKEVAEEELKEHGAVLLRNMGLKTAMDFEEFMKILNWDLFPYLGFGNDARKHLSERVWTTNEGPLTREIFFHHEMAYAKEFPSKLAFFCVEPPTRGEGQTAVLKSETVLKRMTQMFPDFVKEVEEKGVSYHALRPSAHTVPPHLKPITWQSYFGTEDPGLAEQRADSKAQYIEWEEDGMAHVITKRFDGIRQFGKARVWFNAIPLYVIFPFNEKESKRWVTLGDGSLVPKELIGDIMKMMNEESVDVEWEKGDLLLIDNLRVMHARRPCQSPHSPRKVVLSMAKYF